MLRISYTFYLLIISALLQQATAQTLLSEDFGEGIPTNWINRVLEGNNQPSSAWLYTNTGPSGPIGGNDLASPTANNGWMIFDSDLNCNNGMSQNAWLITPPITAGNAETVFLQFATYYQSYNDRPQIRIGADLNDLNSWTTLEVFPGIEANEFGGPDPRGNINPVNIYRDLSPWLAGHSDRRIAFQFLSNNNTVNGTPDDIACAYAWQIDDVTLTVEDPRPAFEMGISRFASVAPNASTPRCQVEPMHFLADVTNNGRSTPDSTVLCLTIYDDTSRDTVFRDCLVYGPITPDSTAENVFFPSSFLPPAEQKLYTGTYSLTYPGVEEDGFLENNSLSFEFEISDSIYSKDQRATRSISPNAGASYAYGNVFFVVNGNGKTIQEVSFAIANTEELIGRRATIFVAAWDGIPTDSILIKPEQYEILGFGDYTFRGDEGTGRISLPVRTIIGDEAIPLQDSTYYLVGVEYNSSDETPMKILATDEYDYFATIFQTDSLGMPRYNSILNVTGVNPVGEFNLLGFGYDIAPTIRMTISDCEPVSSNEPSSSSQIAQVYPNPAEDEIIVSLEQRATCRLYSVQGKLLRTTSDTAQSQISIDLSDLAAGSYLLEVRGENTRQTMLVVKL